MPGSLDHDGLLRAFERLGELAQAEAITIEIAVFGGAYIVLSTRIRESTRDVDAIFRAEDEAAYRLSERVAREQQLPPDWLNQSVKRYVGPPGAPQPDLLPFGEFPRTGAPGLRVLVPRPEYVLAMKLLANRDSLEDIARDAKDIVGLMSACEFTTKQQLLDLMARFYPTSRSLVPRISARLDDIFRQRGDGVPGDG